MKIKKITLAVLLSLTSVAYAAEKIDAPEVAVNANPLIESIDVDEFSSTSAIVSEKQIKDLNAVDIAAALRRTPGVQISRYNPVGAYGGDQGGAVFIRGMGVSRPGSEIKTYIDDIPFYMGVWNHPLLDLLPVNGMQSITVYKSPQPQVNGNNFASIDLTTRTASENGIHGDTRMSAGAFGTVVEQANIAGKQDALDFSFAQGYAKSNGHRPNADGELKNAMGKVGVQFNEHWRAEAGFLYVDNDASDPGDARNPLSTVAKYKTKAGMLTASLSHNYENLQGEAKVYVNQGEGNLYNDERPGGWHTFLTNFDMSGIRVKETLSPWHNGKVKIGVDYDQVSGDVNGAMTGGTVDMPTFRITSPYIALSQTFEVNKDWSLVPSAGLRYYDHNVYESKLAPHAGLSLVSDQATVFANYAKGINYPGLELNAIKTALPIFFAGTNNQLKAEELDHLEIGLKLSPAKSTDVNISVFRDEVKNRYVYDNCFDCVFFGGALASFYNTGKYHNTGAEFSVKQKLSNDWVAFGGLTLLNPSLDNLPYTPDRAFTAGLNGSISGFKISIDAQSQSAVFALNRDRNTVIPNTEKVSGFTVVNARVSYPVEQLGKKGEVFVAIENLFDRDYAYRPGYQMPGIFGQAGFSASF